MRSMASRTVSCMCRWCGCVVMRLSTGWPRSTTSPPTSRPKMSRSVRTPASVPSGRVTNTESPVPVRCIVAMQSARLVPGSTVTGSRRPMTWIFSSASAGTRVATPRSESSFIAKSVVRSRGEAGEPNVTLGYHRRRSQRAIAEGEHVLTMAVGHSDDVDLEDSVDEVIAQCRATLGDRQPQAGILIASFDTFDPSIVARVREAFDGVDIMGATSAAEISSASGYREDSTALALFVSDTVDITVGLGRGLSVAVDRACREAAEQALGATERDPRICIVFAGMNRIDPQHVLDAMADALPAGVAVVGGGSGRSDGDPSGPTYE